MTINTFAIIHKDNPGEVLKTLNVSGDSKELSFSLAEEGLNSYREGLQVEDMNFE